MVGGWFIVDDLEINYGPERMSFQKQNADFLTLFIPCINLERRLAL